MENTDKTHPRRVFKYAPSSIFANQWSNMAFGIGMTVIPALFPFGLHIRRLKILSPEVFSTILILGGIVLLFFAWTGIRKARILKTYGGRITVDGDRVDYPETVGGKVEYRSFPISGIEHIKDDEQESQCEVSLPTGRITFEIKYFDSRDEFEAFRALIGRY